MFSSVVTMLVVALIDYRDTITFKYEYLNIKMLTAHYHNKNTDRLLSMHRVNNGLSCGKAQEGFGRWMRN